MKLYEKVVGEDSSKRGNTALERLVGVHYRVCVNLCLSRDGKEELLQLNDEQRKQLQQRENSRFCQF